MSSADRMWIRTASDGEYEAVRAFYYDLIDAMADAPYSPCWKKGIYPEDAYLLESIRRGELYIGLCGGTIAAAMVVNHACNDGYAGVRWTVEASPEEVIVIHALGVHPSFSRRGFAKALVRHAAEKGRAHEAKVIRLDVLGGNLPAERLYAGMGFSYIATVPLYYEDTGWMEFLLYEYAL